MGVKPRVDISANKKEKKFKGIVTKIDYDKEEISIHPAPNGIVKVIKFIHFLIEVLPLVQRVLLLISMKWKKKRY